jgi:hypothetical protein
MDRRSGPFATRFVRVPPVHPSAPLRRGADLIQGLGFWVLGLG